MSVHIEGSGEVVSEQSLPPGLRGKEKGKGKLKGASRPRTRYKKGLELATEGKEKGK